MRHPHIPITCVGWHRNTWHDCFPWVPKKTTPFVKSSIGRNLGNRTVETPNKLSPSLWATPRWVRQPPVVSFCVLEPSIGSDSPYARMQLNGQRSGKVHSLREKVSEVARTLPAAGHEFSSIFRLLYTVGIFFHIIIKHGTHHVVILTNHGSVKESHFFGNGSHN